MIRKEGDEYCVVMDDGAGVKKCFPTEDEAKAHESSMAAKAARADALLSPALKGRQRADAIALSAAVMAEHPDEPDVRFLARQLVVLEETAFVARFGCQRIADMVGEHGIDPDICAATASWLDDPEGFCVRLKKAATACGFVSMQAARDAGRLAIQLGEIPIDGAVETLENGDVRKWIPLALAGEDWKNGPFEFDITPKEIQQGIDNWIADGRLPIPVTLGHVDNSDAPAAAWIEDLALRDGEPYGLVRFLAKTWERIIAGEFKFFSLEFYQNGVDRKGNEIGFKFDGGGILNKPYFPIRVDDVPEQTASRAMRYRLSRFTSGDSRTPKEEVPMTTPAATTAAAAPAATPAKIEAAKVEGGKVTLNQEQFDVLMRSHRENETLRGEITTLRSEKESVEGRLTRLERERVHDRIKNAVSKLQDRGVIVQLGDYAIDIQSSAFEWLASAPWGVTSVEGLEKLAKDEDATAHLPRIKLGGEKSGGSDRQPPVDLSTEAGRQEAVRRRVAQLKREYRPEELAVALRNRPGGIEAMAKDDLAAEHPEQRAEFQKMESGKK